LNSYKQVVQYSPERFISSPAITN